MAGPEPTLTSYVAELPSALSFHLSPFEALHMRVSEDTRYT